jgi:hypothetical protein
MKFPRIIKTILIGAGVVIIALAVLNYKARNIAHLPISDVAHQAVSYRLKFLCEGIYQYRAATAHWPAKAADLAGTPMALQMRYWDDDIYSGRVVVLWPRDWPANPRDNTGKILAYYNAGLISEFGKQWVCWGDLRTEYLPTEKLQNLLKGQ